MGIQNRSTYFHHEVCYPCHLLRRRRGLHQQVRSQERWCRLLVQRSVHWPVQLWCLQRVGDRPPGCLLLAVVLVVVAVSDQLPAGYLLPVQGECVLEMNG